MCRKFVAASDTRGIIFDENGLDLAALVALTTEDRALHDYPRGRKLDRDAVIDVACEIWIPAARPDVIHAGNEHTAGSERLFGLRRQWDIGTLGNEPRLQPRDDEVRHTGALPRSAALLLATERVRRAMQARRWDSVTA